MDKGESPREKSKDIAIEEQFLGDVKEIVRNRRYTYGEAVTSFEKVAKKWSVTLGAEVTAEQVILCMIDLKTLRFQRNSNKQKDSVYDIAGYSALLANFFNKGD